MKPPSDYEANLFQARIYLAESKRRGRSSFAHVLLAWAGNARRRAMVAKREPMQADMFGGAA